VPRVRRKISSGSRWELAYGYSRAVVEGDRCWVAGTTDPSGDHPGDPAGQARAALGIIERALAEAGFALSDVVRTRMYVTDVDHATAVATVHGEVFAAIRPASSLVVVKALIEPALLVEIEAEALRDDEVAGDGEP
jgi:enamine deaminase RidA (YjgF/YER057c/UK114 family)